MGASSPQEKGATFCHRYFSGSMHQDVVPVAIGRIMLPPVIIIKEVTATATKASSTDTRLDAIAVVGDEAASS